MLFYRLLFLILLPVLGLRMILAWVSGRETTTGITQRFGFGQSVRPPGPVLWLHGASLGELTAARGLINDILDWQPNLHILVSANTYTGRDLVASWNAARVIPMLAPLDSWASVRRFLNHWQPVAMISLENEIWPERLTSAAHRHIPILLVAARLSEKSQGVWARFPGFSSRVMGEITAVFPMDSENGTRFLSIGLPPDRLFSPINLKAGVVLDGANPAEQTALEHFFPRPHTILAASTHPGEEETILTSFAHANRIDPRLRLILAPRHTTRTAEISKLIRQAELSVVIRSKGEHPDMNSQVYLADTNGEMPLWYALSGRTFLGGSLVDKGGHSPIEPVQFGSLVAHGPSIENHRLAFQALHRVGASVKISDGSALTAYFSTPLDDAAPARAEQAKAALSELQKTGSGTQLVIKILSELTPPA